ncbi:MAG: fumarylacetoacetate hydrolase family protein [Sphingomonadaceae bacterium]
MSQLFNLPPAPVLAVTGENATFPVNRIFCVGKNYADHVREMGGEPDAEKGTPIYFTKSHPAFCASGATIAYAPGTANFHYEMELVVAIGSPGFRIAEADAMDHVFGYACGLDMTRRDLQSAAKDKGNPWDTAKDFENAAVLAPLTRKDAFGTLADQPLSLMQNGETRQQAALSQMIWSVPEVIADLSRMYHLTAGDLIFTGTPAGVGPVAPGDELTGSIAGLEDVRLTIGTPE